MSREAIILDRFLSGYKRCSNRKENLEERRKRIIKNFDSPLSAVNVKEQPRGSRNEIGSASLSLQLDEIDTRMKEEIEELQKEFLTISSIIAFLPTDSDERAILEYKYIDGYSWQKISEIENLTKTPINRRWKKGLETLLTYAKVQKIVQDILNKDQG